ncbi:MAG: DUF4276 family protein [Tannerellaceae bacterium]
MKRLVFLVEGDTEAILINKLVIPHLYSLGFTNVMNAQKIVTNAKLNKKGGNVSFQYLENDVKRVMAQGDVIITTFLDLFRLPVDFPGYTDDASRIDAIEQETQAVLSKYGDVYPYIQKYEMEALMFASMDGFDLVVEDEKAINELRAIVGSLAPEDINGGRDTAPSKRLAKFFNYDKVADGEIILEMIGLERIRERCPRFDQWITKIENLLRNL